VRNVTESGREQWTTPECAGHAVQRFQAVVFRPVRAQALFLVGGGDGRLFAGERRVKRVPAFDARWSCFVQQVYAYINVLYTYVLEENRDTEFTLYNGAAESLNTLLGTYTINISKFPPGVVGPRLIVVRCFRGHRGVHHKQSELELVLGRRFVLRRRIPRVVRRTVVLRLLPELMVHLRFLHSLRDDVPDHVDHRRVSIWTRTVTFGGRP